MARNPSHQLASIRAEKERRELARTKANADAIREQCKTLAGFVRAAWKYIDPADFVDNWHIDVICGELEKVAFGKTRRLIINIPPRHMKSLLVSVAFPAWVWTLEKTSALSGPGVEFLCLSYAASLSTRDNVKCRRLIESPWYKALWGDKFALAKDQNTKTRFENNHRGYRIASSVDGTATGEGGGVVSIDDAMSADDANSAAARTTVKEWWDGTMTTRLNDPKTGAYIVTAQRLHDEDLVGHILKKSLPGEWVHLCLPARYEPDHPSAWPADPRTVKGEPLWKARYGEAELVTLEAGLGTYGTAGQLQQRPAPAGGGIFKTAWWKYYTPEALPKAGRILQSWDTAFKAKTENDYSVCTTWAECETGYYLIDLWKEKLEFPELKRMVVSLAAKHSPNGILVEDKASGQSLIQELQRETRLPIIPVPVDADKIARAYAVTPLIESGRVFLADGAAWVADFTTSLAAFPRGAHDDDVDSTTQALAYMAREQITSAGFLDMIRKQALTRQAEAVAALAPPPSTFCPYPAGSVEYERFHGRA